MLRRLWIGLYIAAAGIVTVCGAGAPPSSATPTVSVERAPTPTATVTPPVIPVTCADLDANWGQNWATVLDVLDKLIAAGQSCGDEPLLSKKYVVHFNYAASLEDQAELEAAIDQYQSALFIDPQQREAFEALIRLEALLVADDGVTHALIPPGQLWQPSGWTPASLSQAPWRAQPVELQFQVVRCAAQPFSVTLDRVSVGSTGS
jgi:hypothetical protein